MSAHTRKHPPLTRLALTAAALAPVLTIAGSVPAQAATVTTPPPAGRSAIEPSTPGCLVGAALLLPMVLGMVMVLNPTHLPETAANYWTGGELGLGGFGGSAFPGFLDKCGIGTGL